MIYLDNAATSWPKPPAVLRAMTDFLETVGANPGRSGHRLSIAAGRIVYEAREAVARLFNAPDPLRVVFGHNATDALNLAILGTLRPGDHVITSSVEHNSVMRPLRALEQRGLHLTVLPCSPDGRLDPTHIDRAVRADTTMIVLTHASNVTGAILPIAEAGAIARRHGLLLLVDAAQTAGTLPIDMQADNIDLLAFTGHKSLYGPTGTGGLVLGERVDEKKLHPLRRGGTGSRSEAESQPQFLPDRFESGTANAVGLAGLLAGIRWTMDREAGAVHDQKQALAHRLWDGLVTVQRVTLYGSEAASRPTGTIAFNIEGLEPSEVGLQLDEEYAILCRVGLHCAPAAHKTIGTYPHGAVRFSLSTFNTRDHIDAAVQAVANLANEV